jgi:hypothetical protein
MALWTRLNLKFTTDFDIPHSLVAAHLCHDWVRFEFEALLFQR